MKTLPVEKQLTSFRLRVFYSMKLVFNRFNAENQSPGLLLCCWSVFLCATIEFQATHQLIRYVKRILFVLISFDVPNLNIRRHDVCIFFLYENKGRCHLIDINEMYLFWQQKLCIKRTSEYRMLNERKHCFFCFFVSI